MGRLLTLVCAGTLSASAAGFTVQGELQPPRPAIVSLHGVQSPLSRQVPVYHDGKFKFRDLPAGTYTIAVFAPKLGEVRQTQSVGPRTADKQGRVRVTVFLNEGRVGSPDDAERRNTVPIASLSIPPKAWKEYEEARKNLARNEIAPAVARLEKAVEIAPNFASAWNNLGTIAYQSRQYPLAEQHFRRAMKADPNSFEPRVNLGGVLLSLGRAEEAVAVNLRCVEERPQDALAHAQLGLAYFVTGDLETAEKHLLAARKLDPGHFSHPQLTLAEIYQRKEKNGAAAAQLEHFLRYHPDDPQAEQIRTRMKALRGEK